MPYWMWIGNSPSQYNGFSLTNLSNAEVNRIVGYEASGSGQIKPVMMNGQLRGGNFQTTFNQPYLGGTAMTYKSPALGEVGATKITTAVTVQIELFDLNSTGVEVSIGKFPGVFLQMSNGDVFFRPNAQSIDAWSGINKLHSMKVISAAAISSTSAINPSVGFNADITEIKIPCFTRGTKIRSVDGYIAVEDLSVGDLVATQANGMQPILWIGSHCLAAVKLRAMPRLRPIRIRAGSLGSGLPQRDLIVSPQHRILIRSKIAGEILDSPEILVAAKHLVEIEGIEVADDLLEVEYFHILLRRHEIVYANGVETETLYTGPEALKSVGEAAAAEILTLFPELADPQYVAVPARPFTTGKMGRKLAARHIQEKRHLVTRVS